VDGTNLYAYVGNNPAGWVDPWGLMAEESCAINPDDLDAAFAEAAIEPTGSEGYWEWVQIPIDTEWEARGKTPAQPAAADEGMSWSDYALAGLQIAGGVAQVAFAAGVAYGTGGAGIFIGAGIAANGADDILTGARSIWYGKPQQSTISWATAGAVGATGLVSGQTAQDIGGWTKTGFNAVSLGASVGTVAQVFTAVPRGYTVAYQMRMAQSSWGAIRETHRRIARQALLRDMNKDASFANAIESCMPGARKALESGKNPAEWVWHHALKSQADGLEGVMQLVPSAQHIKSSSWWNVFHPNGYGGYSEWAMPLGAP